MGLFFIYSLKVAFCLIAFYLVYKLLLSKETFHAFNRVVLLSVVAVSIMIPFLKVTTEEPAAIAEGMISLETMIVSAEALEAEPSSGFTLMQVLFIIYIIGIVVFFVREVVSTFRLVHLMSRGTVLSPEQAEQAGIRQQGVRLVVMKDDIAPFSWFRHIVISEKDWRVNPREILTHEQAHIRLCHSWDVAVCNLLIIFQWWNPAAWLLKRELQNVHEFEADEAVIKRGVDAKQYQLLLIRKSVGERLFTMANNLNHHSLKKRITMMTTKKSSPWQKAKALVALPMAALAVVAFANPEVKRIAEQVETESETVVSRAVAEVNTETPPMAAAIEEVAENDNQLEKTVTVEGTVIGKEDGEPIIGAVVLIRGSKKGAVTDPEGKYQLENVPIGSWIDVMMVDCEIGSQQVTEQNAKNLNFTIAFETPASKKSADGDAFDVVEQMPEFPGGVGAMMHFFNENIKYPKEAFDAKQQGRVIVQFVVEKDGAISNVHVVKSVNPSLDTEAARVIKSMPNWKAGLQNGSPVRVKYTVPVTFQLTGDNDAQATAQPASDNDLPVLRLNAIPDDYIVVVDGKVVPTAEIEKYVSSDKVKSISVNKDASQIKAKYGNIATGKKALIEIATKK